MAGDGITAGSLAFKFIGNYIAGNKASAMALNQQTLGMQQEAEAWDRNAADNKAIGEANLTNQIRTGYKAGLLNVQRAQAKKRSMQEGSDLGRAAQQALGAATANAAAAGSIGSSVDAVVGDIYQKVDEAAAQLGANYEQQSDNFDTQLTDLLTQGHDVIRAASKATVRKTPKAQTTGIGEAFTGAVIDVAGEYLSAAMKLGLGKPA